MLSKKISDGGLHNDQSLMLFKDADDDSFDHGTMPLAASKR